jgi:hypothetical protein
MIIRNKFNGYINGNNRLYPGGGGGGQTTSTGTTYTTNIPEYARPYVDQMLGATQKQIFTGTGSGENFQPTGFNAYMPYGSTFQKDAQGNPLKDPKGNIVYTNNALQQAQAAVAPMSFGQQAATSGINQYVAPQQTDAASQIAGSVAGKSAQSGVYSPLRAERFQLGAPQQVRSDSFTAPYVSQAYMSPYMQNVVNTQQREAMRQGEIQRNQLQAQAVGQGAFGGSRQAIMEAERRRNLATQLGDIQGQGLQNAYGAGQQQFNAEQAAYLQAQQANQSANLQTGVQNQQAQLQAQAAQEASRQFGANLGLQGYGQTLQAAQLLGNMGQQQYAQDMGTIQAMSDMGAKEQAQQQAIINQQIQNYATQQQYPYMQLGIMSNMLRGLPMQAGNTSMYQAQPMGIQQLAGTAGALYEMGKVKKEGGVIKMAAGGAVPQITGGIESGVNPYQLPGMARRLSDPQLQQKLANQQTDPATMGIMQAESQRRTNTRNGVVSAANGGAVAFAKGGGSSIGEQYKKDIAPAIEAANKEDESEVMLKDSLKREMATANKTPEDLVKEQRDFNTAAGVPTNLTKNLRDTYTKQLDNMASETENDRAMRRAQAWAVFGSTPGPILKVGLQALQSYIDTELEDNKQRKKMTNELNKAIFELDQSDYLEKAGIAKGAMERREKSWGRIESINEKLVTVNQRKKEAVLGATARGAEADVVGKYGVKKEEIQAASREKSDQKILDRQKLNEQARIDRETKVVEKSMDDYDKDKPRQLRISMANTIINSRDSDPEKVIEAKAVLETEKAERRQRENELRARHPDARYAFEKEGASAPATNNRVVHFDSIK